MALIGQAVSEKMFENHGHVRVYITGRGADNHMGVNLFFYQHKSSVSLHLSFPLNDIVSYFSNSNR